MSQSDVAAVKARVFILIARWIRPTGLGWWKINVSYFDGPWDKTPLRGLGPNHVCLMDVDVDWRYMQATIRVDCAACADLKDDELEYAFVHELMHIFVREMRPAFDRESEVQRIVADESQEHEERVCTQLAKAMIWTREHAQDEVKKKRKR